MTRALLIDLALVLVAGMAFAQAGYIGIFSDPLGANCELDATPTGIRANAEGQPVFPTSSAMVTQYYIVHVGAVDALQIRFAAPKPECLAADWVQDASAFGYTGNSQTGIQIGYGACQTGTLHILTISYVLNGLTAGCCYYPVVADPGVSSGKVEVVDCHAHLSYATGFYGIINANSTCNCNIPAEETTWGKVKSLYAE